MSRRLVLVLGFSPLVVMAACVGAAATASARRTATISLVGTNDLHGHVERLPMLAGYLANLRAARARDGGGVVLVDAGDMFQGTLESNLGEGTAVTRAYNALGYAAVVIGNHEFDFGPVGEAATPKAPGDDPRGALKARAAEARFPFLAANIVDLETGKLVGWPNVAPSVMVEVAGMKIGIVGVGTESTPYTTIAANFRGLRMTPLADAIAREAAALRQAGAVAVVAVAHAGGNCRRFDNPRDVSSCDADEEIFAVVKALPKGAVDAVVGGHTHAGIAHLVGGVPVVESFTGGRAFGRIDLTVDLTAGHVTDAAIFPPKDLCGRKAKGEACEAGGYEGAPVVADAAIRALLAPDVARASGLREKKLGVRLDAEVRRAYDTESALGNLFADLMRVARPEAQVAITNGGGLRADLPAGELTYGQLYEAFPFDNRFATLKLRGAELRELLLANLARDGGILSVSGIRAKASCAGSSLTVALEWENGKAIDDAALLTLTTSDFLATGGDAILSGAKTKGGPPILDDGPPIREAMAAVLAARGGVVQAGELFNTAHRRLAFPGERPVRCGVAGRP